MLRDTGTVSPIRLRRPEDLVIELPAGRTLHAVAWPGAGPAVVLLHGVLDSAEGWAGLCRASRRRCVAFDVPGFGSSSLPGRPRISAYADDIVAGLDELGLERFVLVGHSLGGAVATAVAERVPERALALLLVAPAGFGRIRLAEAVSLPGIRNVAQLALPFLLGNREALDLAYRTFVSGGMAAEGDVLTRVVDHAGALVPGAREATKAVVAAGLSDRAFHRRIVGYDGPVVALWGDRDRLVPPEHLEGVAAAFPHVEAIVWRGMAHHPQHERPEAFAELVERLARDATVPARTLRRAA